MNTCPAHPRMRKSILFHSHNTATHYAQGDGEGHWYLFGRCIHCGSDVCASVSAVALAEDDDLAMYGVRHRPGSVLDIEPIGMEAKRWG